MLVPKGRAATPAGQSFLRIGARSHGLVGGLAVRSEEGGGVFEIADFEPSRDVRPDPSARPDRKDARPLASYGASGLP